MAQPESAIGIHTLIAFQGYLEKKSLHLKLFRKRWTVLKRHGYLYFYKTKSMENEPTEIINIKEYTTVKRNNNTFCLNSDKKEIQNRVFRSKDKSLYNQWVNKITTLIRIAHAREDGIFDFADRYIHVSEQKIDCPYLLKSNSTQPLDCPIYYEMKQRYKYTQKYLNHLIQYKHFKREFEDKAKCRYGYECKSYIRSEQGIDENRINDKCHMKLYRHPPRTRQIKLAQNIHSFVINKDKNSNQSVYKPTMQDQQKYWRNKKDGYIQALIEEVINNGYAYDLCLNCGQNDECKHNVNDKQNQYSILRIVDEKINHNRHKLMASLYPISSCLNRGQMLALVLYTGCECNYNLCASQRNGDYTKWKWFDFCLWWAIHRLSIKEKGQFSAFSGLSGVKLNQKNIIEGYFVTYVSSSWRKEVATAFMGANEGMIIEIDEQFKNDDLIFCCDVSWISKFPDECEILFARSEAHRLDAFSCLVLDESNGVQTVSLKY